MNPIQNSFGKRQQRGVNYIPSAYCIWNPYDKFHNVLIKDSYLSVTRNGGVGVVRGTIGKSSGKWYWEVKIDSFTSVCDVYIGVANSSCTLSANLGSTNDGWSLVQDDGGYYHNGFVNILTSYTTSANDIIGVALDMDIGTLTFYKNNSLLGGGPLFTGITGTIYPALSFQNNAANLTANFGASAQTYTAPSGYTAGVY